MIDKILIVGPSSDIVNFDKEYFEKKKLNGYSIFSYSDSLLHLEKIKVQPDYWFFIDPYTLKRYYKRFNNDYYKEVTLITPNLYDNKFSNFFNEGFTCNSLKKNKKIFNEIVNLDFSSIFKEYIKLDYTCIKYNNKVNLNYDLFETNYIFQRVGKNQCKLSHNLIPLLIFYFKYLKKITSIGFGHYNLSRYIEDNNKRGYPEYIESFDKIKNLIKINLQKYNIQIKFEGKESHFNQLINE